MLIKDRFPSCSQEATSTVIQVYILPRVIDETDRENLPR